jgi:hypothetical protein
MDVIENYIRKMNGLPTKLLRLLGLLTLFQRQLQLLELLQLLFCVVSLELSLFS